jgi:hypothetical protein
MSRVTAAWVSGMLCVVGGSASGKPRSVSVPEELEGASLIAWVRVGGYADGQLWWTPLSPTGGLTHAQCNAPEDVTPRPTSSAQLAHAPHLTALWPPSGAEVLVVVSREGTLSLLGRREGTEVRLWSPLNTGSVALFRCRLPWKPLPGEDLPKMPETSWDGCRLPISALVLKPAEARDAGNQGPP